MSQSGQLNSGSGGGGGFPISTINGDTGSITGSTVTIYANNAAQQAGSTVKFVNTGTISTFTISDASHNTILGKSAGNATLSGTQNVGFGDNSLLSLTIGSENTCYGYDAGVAITTGNFNTCLGNAAGAALKTGVNNLLIGNSAGANYAGAESSNIVIGQVTGTTSESNVIRIGTQGSSTGQQNKAFIAGIVGVTASNQQFVTINSSTGQLGVTNQSLPWSDTSGTVTAVANHGYFITGASTSTLPASPSEGDIVSYVVDTASTLTITASTGKFIRVGAALSASAGTCVNTARGDSITLVYRATGTTWFSLTGPQGIWNIT